MAKIKYDATSLRLTPNQKAAYIKAARSNYSDEGTIEFDAIPAVSWVGDDDGDRGAYVQAWVWVDVADLRQRGGD